jgi:hypothetical protein
MKTSIFSRFKGYLNRAERWYLETPDRALDHAYDAALKIKAIEDEHFDSKKIAPESTKMSPNVFAFFETDLKKYLKIVRIGLAEFKLSRSTLNLTNPDVSDRPLRTIETSEFGSSRFVSTAEDRPAILL